MVFQPDRVYEVRKPYIPGCLFVSETSLQTFDNPEDLLALTEFQKIRLRELEAIIQADLASFRAVIKALTELHDSRVYRFHAKSWEGYLKFKWPSIHEDFGIRRIFQLMEHERTVQSVEAESANRGSHFPLPDNERQTRPLTQLPVEERPAAWQLAVEANDGKVPTGVQVAATVAALSPSAATSARIGALDTSRTPAPVATTPEPIPRSPYKKGFSVSAFRYDANAKKFHFEVFKPANTFKGYPARREGLQIDLEDLAWELNNVGFALRPLIEAESDAEQDEADAPASNKGKNGKAASLEDEGVRDVLRKEQDRLAAIGVKAVYSDKLKQADERAAQPSLSMYDPPSIIDDSPSALDGFFQDFPQ